MSTDCYLDYNTKSRFKKKHQNIFTTNSSSGWLTEVMWQEQSIPSVTMYTFIVKLPYYYQQLNKTKTI